MEVPALVTSSFRKKWENSRGADLQQGLQGEASVRRSSRASRSYFVQADPVQADSVQADFVQADPILCKQILCRRILCSHIQMSALMVNGH